MKEIQDKKKKKITPIPYHSNTYYSVFRNKPLLSKGIDQACQQCSLTSNGKVLFKGQEMTLYIV